MKNMNPNSTNKILVLLSKLVLFLILSYGCHNRNEHSEQELHQAVFDLFEQDTLASFYLAEFQKGTDEDWKRYLVKHAVTKNFDQFGVKIYYYQLPQFCSGCVNNYSALGVIGSTNISAVFPLMDELNLRMASFNTNTQVELPVNFILTNSFLPSKESQQIIVRFILDSLLGATMLQPSDSSFLKTFGVKIKDELSFKFEKLKHVDTTDLSMMYKNQIIRDFTCFNNLDTNIDYVINNLKSTNKSYFFSRGGIYEVTYNEYDLSNVSIRVLNESCYGELLL